VPVPIGTVVRDADTHEELGDLTRDGDELLVARGARRLGEPALQVEHQSHTAPVRPGACRERRLLEFELKVIADVGLLGLPMPANPRSSVRSPPRGQGRGLSVHHPAPEPGSGDVGSTAASSWPTSRSHRRGRAGAGLGIRFLKHLQRTRLLLHLVDIAPLDPEADRYATHAPSFRS